MQSFSPDSPPTAGFSLIEVLVALVITGLALTAIAGVLGTGYASTQATEKVATALTLAESRIATLGTAEPLRPGSSKGQFDNRFHWQVTITPFEDRQDTTTSRFERSLSERPLYRIETIVTWREGARQRQVSLATLRLGPAQP